MNDIIKNWKTSINGVLAFLIATGTVLLATQTPLISTHVTAIITLVLALCRAYVGLIQKDTSSN